MIVVSNTSPVTNLAAIGSFDLLADLFGHVHLAIAVVDELASGGRKWPGHDEATQADWISTHPVANRQLVDALRLDLDSGEAETIALALQLGADLVLLDEQAGRLAAQHFGLRVMGVVGLLLRAKALGHIREVRPLLDSLRWGAGFYLDDTLYNHALGLALET